MTLEEELRIFDIEINRPENLRKSFDEKLNLMQEDICNKYDINLKTFMCEYTKFKCKQYNLNNENFGDC